MGSGTSRRNACGRAFFFKHWSGAPKKRNVANLTAGTWDEISDRTRRIA